MTLQKSPHINPRHIIKHLFCIFSMLLSLQASAETLSCKMTFEDQSSGVISFTRDKDKFITPCGLSNNFRCEAEIIDENSNHIVFADIRLGNIFMYVFDKEHLILYGNSYADTGDEFWQQHSQGKCSIID